MRPASLYRYIWQTTRRRQLAILMLTALIVPLAMAPLEVQRRIVDRAIAEGDLRQLALLVVVYLAVILVQGGLEYVLNLNKGRVHEGGRPGPAPAHPGGLRGTPGARPAA